MSKRLLCNNNNIRSLYMPSCEIRDSSDSFRNKVNGFRNWTQVYVIIIIKWEIGFESYSLK